MMKLFNASLPMADLGEVLRYMGAPKDEEMLLPLIRSCLEECDRHAVFMPRAIYDLVPTDLLRQMANGSQTLEKALCGCQTALVFAATLGHGIDRLIARYSRIEPSRALCLQAIGSERIEAFCDCLCKQADSPHLLRPRISPGYGDLPLTMQKTLFEVFDITHLCGITLSKGLLMSPSKSVTGIAGKPIL